MGIALPSSIQWAVADRCSQALETVVDHLNRIFPVNFIFREPADCES